MEISIILDNELVYNKEMFVKKDYAKEVDNLIGRIMKDAKLKKSLIFLFAGLNIAKSVKADTGQAFTKLDNAGWIFLGIVQKLGFWICLIGCLLEILFAVFKEGKGKSALLPIALKWVGIYLAFFLIPEVFILIRDLFA